MVVEGRVNGKFVRLSRRTAAPTSAALRSPPPVVGEHVVVHPLVALAFLDQSRLDQRVEIRIQPTAVYVHIVVLLHVLFDSQSVRLAVTSDDVQNVALEFRQLVHRQYCRYMYE
jgi:hypothetical protein